MDQTAAAGPDPALSRAVSADLENIFQAAPAAPEALRPGRVRSFAAAAAARRERRPAQMGAMIATALAGLALGAMLAKPSKPEAEPAPKVQQVARLDLPPVAAPPATATLAAAPVETPAVTPASPAVAAEKPAEPRKAAAKPAARKAAERRRSGGGYACNGLTRADEARCAYPAVMAADRSLRAAYNRAVRAGVSRSTLVDYRSRWASLRHRADDQPAKVIYGYRAMARDLDRLSRGSET